MDPFDRAVTDLDDLLGGYGSVNPKAITKELDRIDPLCEELIAATPMAMLATSDAAGRLDVTPRGGPAGFIAVLEHRYLVLGDAAGNNRLDSLRNILETGRAGLLLMIPGREWTLRANGSACVTRDPAVLEQLQADGKPARTAVVIDPDEVYVHCPKAFTRSKLWQPETWPQPDALPTPNAVIAAHMAATAGRAGRSCAAAGEGAPASSPS